MCIIFVFIFNLLQLQLFALADSSTYVPSENIAINCGSIASQVQHYGGRNWTGDVPNKSLIAEAPAIVDSVPQVPYMTARIFRSPFTYKFNVKPGPKFIRLHFYPASYLNMNVSKAFLSVTAANNFTLLHNFSVSLNTDYFNVPYLMKEFIIYVSGRSLELTFSPSLSNATDAYAFVNGIEVVSMPFSLYHSCLDSPLPLVGHYPALYYICDDIAMETLFRLNVGGDQIAPEYDETGMFRTWEGDDTYIFGAGKGIEPVDMTMPVLYANGVPSYAAPKDVYRTSRSMSPFPAGLINLNYNLTWLFHVDSGFKYLVRLHFCEIDSLITKVNQVVFSIYLNNQTAYAGFDPIAVSGGPGVGMYQDYVVIVPGSSEAKQDLWLDLHPYKYSKPMYYTSYLNGVEIFKLSSTYDKNLSGLNPSPLKSHSRLGANASHNVSKNKKKIKFTILIGCGIAAALVIPILLWLILCKIIRPKRRMMPCFDLFAIKTNIVKEENKTPFGAHMSLQKIKAATSNFDETLMISKGGFGKVYKGSFDAGNTYVAVKRGDRLSEQGALEYKTEIDLLSQLRHHNLVSLLGYCNEDEEMILVYNFMDNGTLYDHLHLRQSDQNQTPLSWIQRLNICIGVAKGLHYLHTGTQHMIIHRDIKTTNILLDNNLVAKISDFGLSKSSYPSCSTTNVKGSAGYLDPEYYKFHKLTQKSDLYSLGVVLLEALSARPAVSQGGDHDNDEDEEPLMLAEFAKLCFENGNLEEIVDPIIQGEIVEECLEVYLGVAMRCLAERGLERPSTADVLQNLEIAKRLQENGGVIPRDGNKQGNGNHALQGNSDLTPGIEFSDLMIPLGR
ncbi:hypothetical protein PIB30_037269 [Stylosanthes scabra]|uniref:Protein kinase domain-containing protein n=1 Tax=Stylosanthes scabra TaxID=79078 RepID=A0ABU6UDE9_9FABA|nr:hypothetical protein [Stylosanthes scabra]